MYFVIYVYVINDDFVVIEKLLFFFGDIDILDVILEYVNKIF